MLPRLRPGDTAYILRQDSYQIGDVIVFPYRNEGFIVHRILQILPSTCVCKGDNSFRLEIVNISDILGKVIHILRGADSIDINSIKIDNLESFIQDSFHINSIFKKAGSKASVTKKSIDYKRYEEQYLYEERVIRLQTIEALRSLFDASALSSLTHIREVMQIFDKHRILELCSLPASEKTPNGFLIKQKRALNKHNYLICFEYLKPVFEDISFLYAIVKGLPLAQIAYQDESFGCSCNLEMLVDKKHLSELENILVRHGFVQGYVKNGAIQPCNKQQCSFYTNNTLELMPYIKQTHSTLHPFVYVYVYHHLLWGNQEDPVVDIDDFLSDVVMKQYNGVVYYTLPPEKLLLHLCISTYKELNSLVLLAIHGWKLRCFCDIYGLLIRNSINTSKVVNMARKYSVDFFVYYSIDYTAKLFGCSNIITPYLELTPYDESLLNCIGMSQKDCKQWPLSLYDRLFCDSVFPYLVPLLTADDYKKIEIYSKVMVE